MNTRRLEEDKKCRFSRGGEIYDYKKRKGENFIDKRISERGNY